MSSVCGWHRFVLLGARRAWRQQGLKGKLALALLAGGGVLVLARLLVQARLLLIHIDPGAPVSLIIGVCAGALAGAAVFIVEYMARSQPIFRAVALQPQLMMRLIACDLAIATGLAILIVSAAYALTFSTTTATEATVSLVLAWLSLFAGSLLRFLTSSHLNRIGTLRIIRARSLRAPYAALIAAAKSRFMPASACLSVRANPLSWPVILILILMLAVLAVLCFRTGSPAVTVLSADQIVLVLQLSAYGVTSLRNGLVSSARRRIDQVMVRDWLCLLVPHALLIGAAIVLAALQRQPQYAILAGATGVLDLWLLYLRLGSILVFLPGQAGTLAALIVAAVAVVGAILPPVGIVLAVAAIWVMAKRIRRVSHEDVSEWVARI